MQLHGNFLYVCKKLPNFKKIYISTYNVGNLAESLIYSVAEPHHFYAAPAPCENFDAAPATAAPVPAPAVQYSKSKICTE
jgi:hypothetical protein